MATIRKNAADWPHRHTYQNLVDIREETSRVGFRVDEIAYENERKVQAHRF